jgi:hypothetical protein
MSKNMKTENAWRTVQLFLSSNGVFEVEVNTDTHNVRCTCPNFDKRKTCAHEKFVDDSAKNNNGIYPVKISPKATEEEMMDAEESPEAFRQFIVKYGKVEVI